MLIAAAAAGRGIALVPKFFVNGHLKQQGLVIPFEVASAIDSAYYLVYPTELRHGKPLELFRAWLLDQASAYNADQNQAPKGRAATRGTPPVLANPSL
jgi:DNA-binding transcriptional LysR family regulator